MKLLRHSPIWWTLLVMLLMTGSGNGISNASAHEITERPLAVLQRDIPKYLTERNFRRALAKSFSASWSNVGIRAILNRIESTQDISILLDRRIDPSLPLTIDIQNQTLEQGLKQLAALANAQTAVVGSNIYIGPPRAVSNLLTLIELKTIQLRAKAVSKNALKPRVLSLSRVNTFHYQDLDTPALLLQQILDTYQIKVTNPKRVPHDLWAHGDLMAVDAIEALSLVLIQLELTWEWNQSLTEMTLIPVPEIVTIEKTYRPKRTSVAAFTNQLKQTFPKISIQPTGTAVTVLAPMDIHQQIEQLINPAKAMERPQPAPADSIPLNRRRFTLRVKQVPLIAIMEKLEQSGIEFAYNPEQLKEQGIDLNQRIDVTVKEADPSEFFNSLFGPLKLEYQIKGNRVELTPL